MSQNKGREEKSQRQGEGTSATTACVTQVMAAVAKLLNPRIVRLNKTYFVNCSFQLI